MSKTYGQMAYEAGSAFWLERGQGPEGGFAPWEDVEQETREYWEAVAKAVAVAVPRHDGIGQDGLSG